MKFGSHCYLFVDRWSDECLHVLDQSAELGLDCFEIAIGDDVQFTPALTRRRAEALGLELVISPGGLWPLACDLASEKPEEREAGLAWHQQQIDLAAELEAVAYCGALYGHTGVVKKQRPDPAELPRMVAGIRQLAEYGAAKSVAVVLEPMSHFRTHLINTPAQIMQLLGLVNHDNLHVLLDTYHMITEVTDYGTAIRTVDDRLWGVHACENNRGVPGSGLLPWHNIFQSLIEVGFDGYMMLETYNSAIDDFAYQRGMFHNVCPDAAAFVKQGIGFLKKSLLLADAE